MFKDKVLLITGGTGSFGNAVLRYAFVVKQIMPDNEMAVLIAHPLAVGVRDIDFLSPVVDRFNLLRGEENFVVFLLRTKRPGFRIVR